jgi:putative nucleotidyltransferase with HDIG domain
VADNKRIEFLIKNMGELPTIPSVYLTVNKMLSDPHTSAIDVGQVVSSDQVIASKILKLANSAFYGFAGRVNTVPHAIAVLGFNATKNVVLTTGVLSALNLKNPIEGFNLAAFWKHSAAVGAIARLAAEEFYAQRKEEAFVAGILHDIGKLILAICSPDDFSHCMEISASKGCLFADAEKEVLGICHTDIASWINRKWNLPREIASVMINHHKNISVLSEHTRMIAIVKLADVLARGLQLGHPCDYSMPILEPSISSLLKVTPKKLDTILAGSFGAVQSSMDFINAS